MNRNPLMLITNALMARSAWLARLMDPRRDIDQECGHPQTLGPEDYQRMWNRGDLAARIISVLPDETWSQPPEIYETEDVNETEFEKGWKELDEQLNLLTFLHRIDVMSGIGRFGILLLGFDDGAEMEKPLPNIDETGQAKSETASQHQLLFIRAFEESLVTVKEIETDTTNPRYGRPTLYEVKFSDSVMGDVNSVVNKLVHWSRVIHVADNRTNSEIFGMPRLQQVFNRGLDLHKITGGSGEMFWKGGFPGLSMESHPNLGEDVELDKESTKEQMEAYMNGLQRYIATVGMEVKSLSIQIADPRPHVEVHCRMIAATIGVPWRVLMGSEEGQLASEQDTKTWNRRLTRRRERYVNPFIIRPLVQRLQAAGSLPVLERFKIHWPDLAMPSEKDTAEAAEKESNAIAKYVQAGGDSLIPPFHYLTLVLGKSEEEAVAIIAAATKAMQMEDPSAMDATDPASNPVAADRQKKQETAQAIAAQLPRPGAAGLPTAGRNVTRRGMGNPANNVGG